MRRFYKYFLLSVIGLSPISFPHFLPPLDICLLADICNHTWIPVCAHENIKDLRLFTDECDLIEYNCDYNASYTITNYSECIRVTCPHIHICPLCPPCNNSTKALRKKITRRTDKYKFHRHLRHDAQHIQHYHAAAHKPDRTKAKPNKRRYIAKRGRKLKKKPKLKKSQYRTTKQIIKTATVSPLQRTVILKTLRMWKDGRSVLKVIKGFSKMNTKVKSNSDFLEK